VHHHRLRQTMKRQDRCGLSPFSHLSFEQLKSGVLLEQEQPLKLKGTKID
jgi:hypothetical protein